MNKIINFAPYISTINPLSSHQQGLTEAQALARIKQLRADLIYHDTKYYGDNAPEISDAAYDDLRKELLFFENNYPEFVIEHFGDLLASNRVGSEYVTTANGEQRVIQHEDDDLNIVSDSDGDPLIDDLAISNDQRDHTLGASHAATTITDAIAPSLDTNTQEQYSEYAALVMPKSQYIPEQVVAQFEYVTLDQVDELYQPYQPFEVEHEKQMLSLANVYDQGEFNQFMDSCYKELTGKVADTLLKKQQVAFCAEPKLDGIAVSLIYTNGVLTRAATRGTGSKGYDITRQISRIPNVPNQVAELVALAAQGKESLIELRGEVIMPQAEFDKINELYIQHGKKPLVNLRNGAGSFISRDPYRKLLKKIRKQHLPEHLQAEITAKLAANVNADSATTATTDSGNDLSYYHLLILDNLPEVQPLKVYIYSVNQKTIDNQDQLEARHSESLAWAKSMGFTVSELIQVVSSPKQINDYYTNIQKIRPTLGFDIDGTVFKVDDYALQETIGWIANSPKWAIAFKFPPTEAVTTLQEVVKSSSRSGQISPVAKVAPCFVGGVTISSVSLHNYYLFQRLNLHFNDKVILYRGGEVIPVIKQAITEQRQPGAIPVDMLLTNPGSGEFLREDIKFVERRYANDPNIKVFDYNKYSHLARELKLPRMSDFSLNAKAISSLEEYDRKQAQAQANQKASSLDTNKASKNSNQNTVTTSATDNQTIMHSGLPTLAKLNILKDEIRQLKATVHHDHTAVAQHRYQLEQLTGNTTATNNDSKNDTAPATGVIADEATISNLQQQLAIAQQAYHTHSKQLAQLETQYEQLLYPIQEAIHGTIASTVEIMGSLFSKAQAKYDINQLRGNLDYFFSKDCIEVKGVAVNTLDLFVRSGAVKTPADVYRLQDPKFLEKISRKLKSLVLYQDSFELAYTMQLDQVAILQQNYQQLLQDFTATATPETEHTPEANLSVGQRYQQQHQALSQFYQHAPTRCHNLFTPYDYPQKIMQLRKRLDKFQSLEQTVPTKAADFAQHYQATGELLNLNFDQQVLSASAQQALAVFDNQVTNINYLGRRLLASSPSQYTQVFNNYSKSLATSYLLQDLVYLQAHNLQQLALPIKLARYFEQIKRVYKVIVASLLVTDEASSLTASNLAQVSANPTAGVTNANYLEPLPASLHSQALVQLEQELDPEVFQAFTTSEFEFVAQLLSHGKQLSFSVSHTPVHQQITVPRILGGHINESLVNIPSDTQRQDLEFNKLQVALVVQDAIATSDTGVEVNSHDQLQKQHEQLLDAEQILEQYLEPLCQEYAYNLQQLYTDLAVYNLSPAIHQQAQQLQGIAPIVDAVVDVFEQQLQGVVSNDTLTASDVADTAIQDINNSTATDIGTNINTELDSDHALAAIEATTAATSPVPVVNTQVAASFTASINYTTASRNIHTSTTGLMALRSKVLDHTTSYGGNHELVGYDHWPTAPFTPEQLAEYDQTIVNPIAYHFKEMIANQPAFNYTLQQLHLADVDKIMNYGQEELYSYLSYTLANYGGGLDKFYLSEICEDILNSAYAQEALTINKSNVISLVDDFGQIISREAANGMTEYHQSPAGQPATTPIVTYAVPQPVMSATKVTTNTTTIAEPQVKFYNQDLAQVYRQGRIFELPNFKVFRYLQEYASQTCLITPTSESTQEKLASYLPVSHSTAQALIELELTRELNTHKQMRIKFQATDLASMVQLVTTYQHHQSLRYLYNLVYDQNCYAKTFEFGFEYYTSELNSFINVGPFVLDKCFDNSKNTSLEHLLQEHSSMLTTMDTKDYGILKESNLIELSINVRTRMMQSLMDFLTVASQYPELASVYGKRFDIYLRLIMADRFVRLQSFRNYLSPFTAKLLPKTNYTDFLIKDELMHYSRFAGMKVKPSEYHNYPRPFKTFAEMHQQMIYADSEYHPDEDFIPGVTQVIHDVRVLYDYAKTIQEQLKVSLPQLSQSEYLIYKQLDKQFLLANPKLHGLEAYYTLVNPKEFDKNLFSGKTYQIITKSLAEKMTIPLEQFYIALGIDGIAGANASLLTHPNLYPTIDHIVNFNAETDFINEIININRFASTPVRDIQAAMYWQREDVKVANNTSTASNTAVDEALDNSEDDQDHTNHGIDPALLTPSFQAFVRKFQQSGMSKAEFVKQQKQRIKDFDGIGLITATNILNFFSNPDNIALVKELLALGVKFTSASSEAKYENIFTGKSVVITGKLEAMNRKSFEQFIKESGGKPQSSVTATTDYLVVGGLQTLDGSTKLTSKMKKAQDNGTTLVTEPQFMVIYNQAK